MPRLLAIITLVLFSLIGVAAFFKNKTAITSENETIIPSNTFSSPSHSTPSSTGIAPLEITLDWDTPSRTSSATPATSPTPEAKTPENLTPQNLQTTETVQEEGLPYANRIEEFFNTRDPRFPFVKTISYKSRVSWLQGRPAWIADYASHYRTSRHFIARSLNGKPDYEKQDIGHGDRFNILDPETELTFRLIIDLSRFKLWFYAEDHTRKQRTLVKVYDVGLGRQDPHKPSGCLTPLGTYSLGDQVAIYKKETKCNYQGRHTEMIRVFGTRWIPFVRNSSQDENEFSDSPKGYGLHGSPWKEDMETKELAESAEGIGHYDSDGCIRLRGKEIEELFSIVISRPTTVEIVEDFKLSTVGKGEGF